MNNPVKQEHSFGCGVACVAVLLNQTYKKTLCLFKNKQQAQTKGFFCKELIEVLNTKGLKYETKKANTFKQDIKDNLIIFIKRNEVYLHGHFLVKTNGLWMDPWINFPKYPIKAGYRKTLPGEAQFILKPVNTC